ncbi:sugar transferase [Candidatus Saccharibacteria bacterium]|nr:sugar transferase [Candidatus Saccharibacteria bacterium]
MKKDPGLIFRVVLVLSDAIAVIVAFLVAYLGRIYIDNRPYFFEAEPGSFISTIILLVPIWLILHAFLGLYNKSIIYNRSRTSELTRLFLASALGIMALITYDFFTGNNIFPTRMVAVYAAVLCFIMLCLFRGLTHHVRAYFARKNYGTLRAIIIGDNMNTERLIDRITDFPEDGYTLAGVVAGKNFVPDDFLDKRYSSLKEALSKTEADVVFQTEEQKSEYIYGQCVKNHLLYYFVPTESSLSSHIGKLELIGDTPAISVKVTPLVGGARIIKRAMDIIIGGLMLLVSAIPMGIIWLIVKLPDIHHPAVYASYRLSRYNKKVKIYKFRSMKSEYSGMSPEDAFKKMGKANLIEKYRSGGDYIPNDPRVTRVGRFLRASSLDELPQLINVVRGDIALVGPRALVPGELRDYGDRSLLLSVKSGLTGLAQVSGRRDISFEERRALDLYYVQNWSVWLDITILARTVVAVILRRGAK